ncbi:MAG: tetratricopeptide repeat protein [Acidobacteriaceae bacterium]|nr:tetratricopeptide repeat protein [Acidobacteriaceae bacterium]
MMTVEQAINLGLQYHQSGQLAAAVDIYGQILAAIPGHADALYLLGMATAALGDQERAVGLIREAIQADHTKFQFHAALAHLLRDLNRPSEAEATACRALALQPGAIELYLLIGQIRALRGDPDGAAAAFRMSIIIVPEYAPGYLGLGTLATAVGDFTTALRVFKIAVRLDSSLTEAQFDLAKALRDSGHLDLALERYRIVLMLAPDYAGASINFGEALYVAGDIPMATLMFRRASILTPDNPQIHSNLALALQAQGALDAAIMAHHEALRLDPNSAQAHNNLALTLQAQGALDAALVAHREALRLDPDYADARTNLALTLLRTGQFAEGWDCYESRFAASDAAPPPAYQQPLWDGRPLKGATILLHAEQGLGDTLQFVRYAPLVAERGGRVVLLCPPELTRLLASVPGIAEVQHDHDDLPDFSWHCPLMSLPRLFGTDLASIPHTIPYVSAAPAAVAFWRHRLATMPGLKVGLVWAGRSRQSVISAQLIDRRRSMSLSQFTPLAVIPGVHLISLQKGEATDQIRQLPQSQMLTDWTPSLLDFADTAALVEALDLVISVDTAVVHLAGALGKPVWVLSRFDACWRWLIDRTDSPWYPTLTLFRQPQPGDWASVVTAVADALSTLSQRQRDRGLTSSVPTSLSL